MEINSTLKQATPAILSKCFCISRQQWQQWNVKTAPQETARVLPREASTPNSHLHQWIYNHISSSMTPNPMSLRRTSQTARRTLHLSQILHDPHRLSNFVFRQFFSSRKFFVQNFVHRQRIYSCRACNALLNFVYLWLAVPCKEQGKLQTQVAAVKGADPTPSGEQLNWSQVERHSAVWETRDPC